MNKFGQVYIRRKIGNSYDNLELIPSARFSNLDHKWYDSDGEIHSEFDQHHGRDISLFFKTTQYDKNGDLVNFQGGMRVPCKLGEIGNQDFEGVDEAGQEDLKILRRFNLIPEDLSEQKTSRLLEITAFLAAIHTGSKLKDIKMHRICNIALFIFDDDMEKLAGSKFNSFREFLNSTNTIMDKNSGVETVNHRKEMVPELLLNHLNLFQFFEKELSNAEGNTNRGKSVRETLMAAVEAICVEVCLEWNEERSALLDSTQKDIRTIATGGSFTLEMIIFEAKINVKAEIRNTALFKLFLRQMAYYIGLTNDLISYRKEVEADRAGCNMVFVLHHNKSIPLQKAMQQILDKANRLSALLVETGEMLTNLYKNDNDLQLYVGKAKNLAYACIQWSTHTDRYHKGWVSNTIAFWKQRCAQMRCSRNAIRNQSSTSTWQTYD
ncbi:unnamed protein product [Orchesella dallaii]|uniref:Terpene synthase n=1 Tax=Orchesella dallaii TaxID=48710 RepID=A0ABP1PSG2_9HEXA